MKTKLYLFTIILAVTGLVSNAKVKDAVIISGNTNTDLGKYTIVKSNVPMVVNDQKLSTYELRYENGSNKIKIGVVEDKNCTVYLVRAENVEVQYTCQRNVFGVRKMEKKYRELQDSDSKINRVNLLSQRIISQTPKSEKDLLGLIACYFPVLVEKEYQAQL